MALKKANKLKNKTKQQYLNRPQLKRKIKNSKFFSNVKCVGDDGLIELKTGGYASLIEIKAIDLSLSSTQEKTNFFHSLKYLKTTISRKSDSIKPMS